VPAEVRELDEQGEIRVVTPPRPILAVAERGGRERRGPGVRAGVNGGGVPAEEQPFRRIYPFGISRKRLEQAIRETGARVALAEELGDADTVMTLRSYFRRKPQALRDAESRGIPIYVLKTNTVVQMEQGLLSMQQQGRPPAVETAAPPVAYALQETEDAIAGVLSGGEAEVELSPQNAYIRRLQHQMAQRYNLTSRSLGREPHRRVRIARDGGDEAWFS